MRVHAANDGPVHEFSSRDLTGEDDDFFGSGAGAGAAYRVPDLRTPPPPPQRRLSAVEEGDEDAATVVSMRY